MRKAHSHAGAISGLLAAYDPAANLPLWYFYDANGNVGQLVDLTPTAWDPNDLDAVMVARYEYEPFGRLALDIADADAAGPYGGENPFRFSTHQADDATGLLYAKNRYYWPDLGRWTTRDPIEESGGANLYNYVLNSAADRVDALGHDVWIASNGVHRKICVGNPCDPEGYACFTFYKKGGWNLLNWWGNCGTVGFDNPGGALVAYRCQSEAQDCALYRSLLELEGSEYHYSLVRYNCRDWVDDVWNHVVIGSGDDCDPPCCYDPGAGGNGGSGLSGSVSCCSCTTTTTSACITSSGALIP